MDEIEANDFNLNISRYVSTAVAEKEVDLAAVHDELVELQKKIKTATSEHNNFLRSRVTLIAGLELAAPIYRMT